MEEFGMDFYNDLQRLLCTDAGGRGLAGAVTSLPLRAVRETLAKATHTLLLTGL